MVDGTLYLDTGYVSSLMRCGTLDGNIEKVVDSTEMPDEDGEANFSAEGWQVGFEVDTLDVRIGNEFCIFAKQGTKKAEDGYIPEGVMQFMATVDDVTDDGYVIVKTDTQSERFPQIRKDLSCAIRFFPCQIQYSQIYVIFLITNDSRSYRLQIKKYSPHFCEVNISHCIISDTIMV